MNGKKSIVLYQEEDFRVVFVPRFTAGIDGQWLYELIWESKTGKDALDVPIWEKTGKQQNLRNFKTIEEWSWLVRFAGLVYGRLRKVIIPPGSGNDDQIEIDAMDNEAESLAWEAAGDLFKGAKINNDELQKNMEKAQAILVDYIRRGIHMERDAIYIEAKNRNLKIADEIKNRYGKNNVIIKNS